MGTVTTAGDKAGITNTVPLVSLLLTIVSPSTMSAVDWSMTGSWKFLVSDQGEWQVWILFQKHLCWGLQLPDTVYRKCQFLVSEGAKEQPWRASDSARQKLQEVQS